MCATTRTLMIAGILSIAALWPRVALADPPARVGRLSYVEGTVSARTGNQDQWNNAVLNVPVTTGDGFWTEANGRTEIEVGPMEVRTDHNTELDITQLDDNATKLEVPQGVINVHIAEMPAGGVSIATPAGETKLNAPGDYRIDAGQPQGNQPGPTEQIAVLQGGAMFTGPNASVNINAGEQAVLNGNPPSSGVERLSMTDFDKWAASRNPRITVSSRERRHVPVQVTGYQDLDRYGRWESDPQYGEVWYPENTPADWAPYREGYWSYVEPWGWTWIDDEPWGFAPYHYGRWLHRHHHWAWYPGSYYEAPPVYAPALVAFVGGSNWGVSLSLGGGEPVGWVPLAPDEPFYPYYRTSDRYRVNINRTTVNKTVIKNITVNNYGAAGATATAARLANRDAVTVVRANDFRRGARADRTAIRVPATAVASASLATPQVASIQPTPEARGGLGAAQANRSNRQAPRPPDRSAWREQRRENRLNVQPTVTGAAATPTPTTTATPAASGPAKTSAASTAAQPTASTANHTTSAPAPHPVNTAEQRREQRQPERPGQAAETGSPRGRRGPHEVANPPVQAAGAAAPENPSASATPAPAAATPAARAQTESANERKRASPEERQGRLHEPPIASGPPAMHETRRGLAEPFIEPSAGAPGKANVRNRVIRQNRPGPHNAARAAHKKEKEGGKNRQEERSNDN